VVSLVENHARVVGWPLDLAGGAHQSVTPETFTCFTRHQKVYWRNDVPRRLLWVALHGSAFSGDGRYL
jgi:hypothetical protein